MEIALQEAVGLACVRASWQMMALLRSSAAMSWVNSARCCRSACLFSPSQHSGMEGEREGSVCLAGRGSREKSTQGEQH